MTDDTGDRVDAYIHDLCISEDDALRQALRNMETAGLPAINVPSALGRLLGILVRSAGGRRVLEIGTLGGYSAIWMARALRAGGKMISLEADPRHAEVARANLARAGLDRCVEVRVGKALDLLPALVAEEPFDLAFIDADKTSYPAYLDWTLRLVRPGGLIVADNVLRGGAVADPADADEGVRATDRFNRAAASDPRLDTIILPNRGGRDGILIAIVRDMPA